MGNICNSDCGLSDCHNFVGVQFRQETQKSNNRYSLNRSFKSFNIDDFNYDLNDNLLKLNTSHTMYDGFKEIFVETANKHAPIKKKKNITKNSPFYEQNT